MKRERILAIFAWFFDTVAIECIIWPFHDLYNENIGIFYYLSLVILLLTFILSIFYHVKWKKSTNWVSPGEYLTGQRMIAGSKKSIKMTLVPRKFLFSIILINLLCTSTSLEVNYYGIENTWSILMISYGVNFLILFGSYRLSEFKSSGIISTGLALGFMVTYHAMNYFGSDIQSARSLYIFYLILLVANIWVYYYYKTRSGVAQDSDFDGIVQA